MRRLVLAVLAVAALAPVSPAAATPDRVSVVVVGDSIVESGHLAAPARDGLLPQLRRALARRGVDSGAPGFVAAHPGQPVRALAAPRSGWAWRYSGPWTWVTRWPGAGVDLLSWTSQPDASATLATSGADSATLLYLSGPLQGRFAFAAGDERVEVDAHAPTGGLGLRTLELPDRGAQRLDVSALEGGGVGLVGAFLRRAPRPGRPQLELTEISRGGAQAADVPSAGENAGIAYLRPRLTVIVMGTNDGIGFAATRDPAVLEALAAGLERRARRATATGDCVIVPPARARFPADVHAVLQATVARAARAGGCATLPLLDVLDTDPRLTTDGVHPSPAGYARLARALAPRLQRLAAPR